MFSRAGDNKLPDGERMRRGRQGRSMEREHLQTSGGRSVEREFLERTATTNRGPSLGGRTPRSAEREMLLTTATMVRTPKKKGLGRSMSFSQDCRTGRGGSATFSHPQTVSILPPPEITRIRSLAVLDRGAPAPRKLAFLGRLGVGQGAGQEAGQWEDKEEQLRKLPLPEIFYSNAAMADSRIVTDRIVTPEDSWKENQFRIQVPWDGPVHLRGTQQEVLHRPQQHEVHHRGQKQQPQQHEVHHRGQQQHEVLHRGQQQQHNPPPGVGQSEVHSQVAEMPTREGSSKSSMDLRELRRNLPDRDLNSKPSLEIKVEKDQRVSDVEGDVWYSKESLYQDHVKEVLEKWGSVDDEIWAKVIILERNRRIAKAYARAPVLTINGSNDGFDGFRIGVNGFENPMRDPKTEEFKRQIGTGCKLKMDDSGNILIKRLSKSGIYAKNTLEETAVSNDILKLPNGMLDPDKPFKLFDMKKFQQNVNRELKRQLPDLRKLENQCISTIALVKNEADLLDSPIWIMLVNIVALEMLKAKIPKPHGVVMSSLNHPNHVKKVGVANSGSSDEDPYSLTPSGSSGSSAKGEMDRSREESSAPDVKTADYYGPQNWPYKGVIQDLSDDYAQIRQKENSRTRAAMLKNAEENRHREDDPYYRGFRARIPNFGQKKEGKARKRESQSQDRLKSPHRCDMAQLPGPGANPFWWHSRLYPDSGLGDLSSGGSESQSSSTPAQSQNRKSLKNENRKSLHFPLTGHPFSKQGVKKDRAYPSQFISASRPAVFTNGWE